MEPRRPLTNPPSGVRRLSIGALFDFALLSGTAIVVDQKTYAGSVAPLLAYIVLAAVLLVRRHKIEPSAATV